MFLIDSVLTAGLAVLPHSRSQRTLVLSTSFHYSVDEMPQGPNCCLYQLACIKTGFIMCCSSSSHRTCQAVKYGLTVSKLVSVRVMYSVCNVNLTGTYSLSEDIWFISCF